MITTIKEIGVENIAGKYLEYYYYIDEYGDAQCEIDEPDDNYTIEHSKIKSYKYIKGIPNKISIWYIECEDCTFYLDDNEEINLITK